MYTLPLCHGLCTACQGCEAQRVYVVDEGARERVDGSRIADAFPRPTASTIFSRCVLVSSKIEVEALQADMQDSERDPAEAGKSD